MNQMPRQWAQENHRVGAAAVSPRRRQPYPLRPAAHEDIMLVPTKPVEIDPAEHVAKVPTTLDAFKQDLAEPDDQPQSPKPDSQPQSPSSPPLKVFRAKKAKKKVREGKGKRGGTAKKQQDDHAVNVKTDVPGLPIERQHTEHQLVVHRGAEELTFGVAFSSVIECGTQTEMQRRVTVTDVQPGSVAEAAGLLIGDVIDSIGGRSCVDMRAIDAIQLLKASSLDATLTVWRFTNKEEMYAQLMDFGQLPFAHDTDLTKVSPALVTSLGSKAVRLEAEASTTSCETSNDSDRETGTGSTTGASTRSLADADAQAEAEVDVEAEAEAEAEAEPPGTKGPREQQSLVLLVVTTGMAMGIFCRGVRPWLVLP